MWFVFIAFDRLIKNLGEWKLGVHFRKIGSGTNRKLFCHEFVRRILTMDFRRTFLSAARWITTQRKKFYTCFYYGIIFGKQFFFGGAAAGEWIAEWLVEIGVACVLVLDVHVSKAKALSNLEQEIEKVSGPNKRKNNTQNWTKLNCVPLCAQSERKPKTKMCIKTNFKWLEI